MLQFQRYLSYQSVSLDVIILNAGHLEEAIELVWEANRALAEEQI